MTWLLLLHQLPPTPPYLRAKILRRLKEIGALPLKKSAYLLPDGEEWLEDFHGLLKEIVSEDGEGWILRTEAIAGLTDVSIRDAFRQLRADDYRELLAEARGPDSDPKKLRKRFEEVRAIDFFDAPGRRELEARMDAMEQKATVAAAPAGDLKGRTWVTRKGIKVDRTASAWLIRRFIDPAAVFAFADPARYQHREGELRFDVYDGEFTHQGDRCTFEVLLEHAGLQDPGLQAIAEIVHDLDLKDKKFGRPERAGVAAMIDGLVLRHAGDEERLAEGLVLFDALYAQLRTKARA